MTNMIDYSYRARNESGKAVRGHLVAESQASVLSSLKSKGLSPISIVEGGKTNGLNRNIEIPQFQGRINSKDLAVMTRQLSTMVSSGLPLAKALLILANQTEKTKLADKLTDVRLDVQAGMSLSNALERSPEVFPVLMTSLVRVGETGGFLDKSLTTIAETFESDAKLKGSIRSAMTYPIAVLVMAVVGVIAMLIFIVPIFEKMFKDLGGVLPWPTQVLVFLSPVAAWSSPFLLVGVLVFSSWWSKNKHLERVRRMVDPLQLRIPVFGTLFKKIAIARFARNFASMIGSGVPIMQGLAVIGKSSGNWVIEQAVSRVQESVRLGSTLAQPMTGEKIFPLMVTQMISVGEDSGSLEVMLTKIAEFYDLEIEATTKQLTSLIEPFMIAFIGLIIGSMIVTLYLPLFTIFTVIK